MGAFSVVEGIAGAAALLDDVAALANVLTSELKDLENLGDIPAECCERIKRRMKGETAKSFHRSFGNPGMASKLSKFSKMLKTGVESVKKCINKSKCPWTSKERKDAWKEKGYEEPPTRIVTVIDKKTGEKEEIEETMELHHLLQRQNGGTNDSSNLKPAWPADHAAEDPYRRVSYFYP